MTRFLARNGEDGADYLRKLDDEDVEELFRRACSTGAYGIQRIGGGGCTDLNNREQRIYTDAVAAADVDPSAFGARLARTDVSDVNARRAFVHIGRPGVKMAIELDDETLNQFVLELTSLLFERSGRFSTWTSTVSRFNSVELTTDLAAV